MVKWDGGNTLAKSVLLMYRTSGKTIVCVCFFTLPVLVYLSVLAVSHRFNSLQVNEEASNEVLEVEQKYNEIRRPVYVRRNEMIQKIPDFWLTAVCNIFLWFMLHLFFEGWCCVWAHLLISNVTVLCTEPAVSQPSYDWRSSN
jgi:nitric oxide reductase large subunit